MDNSHYFDSHLHEPFRKQRQLPDNNVLPELTEEVERLLAELQKQEVDVDEHTLQRVLDYARKSVES
ncbi:MAG: hypothetical protein LBB79_07820 [Prevotellaceae bacterium]|jgi:hypothetical protein|nr:hypothetical protein [Prevotellaceae bacterium]